MIESINKEINKYTHTQNIVSKEIEMTIFVEITNNTEKTIKRNHVI